MKKNAVTDRTQGKLENGEYIPPEIPHRRSDGSLNVLYFMEIADELGTTIFYSSATDSQKLRMVALIKNYYHRNGICPK